jgi:tetratricopeptide (TPR) repeat protein
LSRGPLRRPTVAAVVALTLAAATGRAQPARPQEGRGEASAQIARIEQLLEDWDLEAARAEAEALAKVMPADAEPLKYYQGRIAFESGRYEEAVELLSQAGIPDKPGSYLRLAKDTLAVVKGYERAESQHFVFFHPAGKDAILAPYALEALEAIRKALHEDLGYAPPEKVRVEVVENAAQLSRVSTLTRAQIRTTGTIAICKFNKLMVTSPKAVITGYDWLDTLAHEYVHLVVSKKSRNTVPIWLHEGLAKYLESRWRGKAGLALSPSTQALLGRRVKQDKLIPFEKMHPSIALLPSAEDAATAFAEVFYAVDWVYRNRGTAGLRQIVDELRGGRSDRDSVEVATGQSFAAFEKAWLQHIRSQPFPKELLPLEEKVLLKEEAPGKAKDEKKGKKEVSFGDFAYVEEVSARKYAHLGELMRERSRPGAAAAEFAKAHRIVGDKYEAISNKYALALLELGQLYDAERVLSGSLRVHPGVAATNVHLGRIFLARNDWAKARTAYMEALATDPFDPEIHLALLHIHRQLGDEKLVERTRKAAALLTGMAEARVVELAEKFATSRRLVEPPVTTPERATAPEKNAPPRR